ncbi:hypothetical protein Agub_g17, partial [Astrephomene gubernaculifera]
EKDELMSATQASGLAEKNIHGMKDLSAPGNAANFYDGWSCFRTLITRDPQLAQERTKAKGSKGKEFSLSMLGLALGARLYKSAVRYREVAPLPGVDEAQVDEDIRRFCAAEEVEPVLQAYPNGTPRNVQRGRAYRGFEPPPREPDGAAAATHAPNQATQATQARRRRGSGASSLGDPGELGGGGGMYGSQEGVGAGLGHVGRGGHGDPGFLSSQGLLGSQGPLGSQPAGAYGAAAGAGAAGLGLGALATSLTGFNPPGGYAAGLASAAGAAPGVAPRAAAAAAAEARAGKVAKAAKPAAPTGHATDAGAAAAAGRGASAAAGKGPSVVVVDLLDSSEEEEKEDASNGVGGGGGPRGSLGAAGADRLSMRAAMDASFAFLSQDPSGGYSQGGHASQPLGSQPGQPQQLLRACGRGWW